MPPSYLKPLISQRSGRATRRLDCHSEQNYRSKLLTLQLAWDEGVCAADLANRPDRHHIPFYHAGIQTHGIRRARDRLCSRVATGRPVKCSPQSNTEQRQPSSECCLRAYRVRRTKRVNSASWSRRTRRSPRTKNGWQSIPATQSRCRAGVCTLGPNEPF
jgi:hypothetical protein